MIFGLDFGVILSIGSILLTILGSAFKIYQLLG